MATGIHRRFTTYNVPLPIVRRRQPDLVAHMTRNIGGLLSPSKGVRSATRAARGVGPRAPVGGVSGGLFTTLFTTLNIRDLATSRSNDMALDHRRTRTIGTTLSGRATSTTTRTTRVSHLAKRLAATRTTRTTLRRRIRGLGGTSNTRASSVRSNRNSRAHTTATSELFGTATKLIWPLGRGGGRCNGRRRLYH